MELTNIRLIDRIAMFLLGAINNLPYVIGIASAQRIVKQFHNETYLGLVFWANTVSGLFARFINTWLASLNVPYEINFCINVAFMLGGLIGCAVSRVFWLTLLCVFFIGFTSNFGESVLLCYLTSRRKQALLSPWSSGTGMAGILGASYSLICALLDVPYLWSFIAVTPVVLIYFCMFFFVIRKSPDEEPENRTAPLLSDTKDMATSEETLEIEKVSCFDFSIIKPVWWFMFNCGAVYFLEYVIQSAFAHCALRPLEAKETGWLFPGLNLAYQVGVFISRSSLNVFKFPWVGWLTLGQCVFFGMWATQPFFYWMAMWAMMIFMVCVGLFGGCSYVNSFHLIMNNPDLTSKQKEMVTSWNAFFISLFIFLATVFTYVSEQTYLKDRVPAD